MLEAKKVTRRYGDHVVLRDITCHIPAAAITAIIGPSGCGKTTLLRMLAFLEEPDEGTVSVTVGKTRYCSGERIKPWPAVTCVFQRQFLWPHLTLRENITLPLRDRGDTKRISHLDEIISMFDMESFLDRYPNQVSGGEAQRAALARAFALSPSFILLDEAHTFLDMGQQRILNSYLAGLRGQGIGLVVVTHSLRFVQAQADGLIVLESGRIAEMGDHTILTSPQSKFLRQALA